MKKERYGYMLFGVLLFSCSAVNATELLKDKQGLTVKQEDVEFMLKNAPEKVQLKLLQNKESLSEKLSQLYLTKAIAQQARQQPLTKEEQNELDNMLLRYHFERKISQLSSENLPDFEPLAKRKYEANKKDFMNPEMVGAEHILIETRKNKHTDKDALKIINDLLAQIKNGASFADLAEKYSDDPSAKQNKGNLGMFAKGQMIKEFEAVAYSLKPNEISEPFKTSYGYHILRVYEHRAPVQKTYAEAKNQLIERVKQDYVQTRLKDYFEKVKKDNAMTLDDKALDTFIAEKTKQLEAKLQPASAPVTAPAAGK